VLGSGRPRVLIINDCVITWNAADVDSVQLRSLLLSIREETCSRFLRAAYFLTYAVDHEEVRLATHALT
jgi:hypothetical protein